MSIRIQVDGVHAAVSRRILSHAADMGVTGLAACRMAHLYFLSEHPGAESIERLCTSLLADPVTERATWIDLSAEQPVSPPGLYVIEVALRPGVTDVAARELARGMAELGVLRCEVATAIRYELTGDLTEGDLRRLARRLLANETVEHYSLGPIPPIFGATTEARGQVESIPLRGLDDDALMALSQERLLSLDRDEMRVIQAFYAEQGRDPTDVELETLAQTWSEHCVHKTFRARIDFTWEDADGNVIGREEVDGLLNQYIRAATEAIDPPWLRSAFVDDAGIIAFDETHDLAFKAETHNHPSALEPFGGANTGVGGVVRDILGVSARPIAVTDALCFAPQDLPYDQLPEGVLHPRRIAEGVVAGIGDYGNKLGLPTVNGAIVYDPGYLGNPLVFCGCVGLLPHGSHPTAAQQGDLVVAVGGRTGRDGIHGATFSSAELTHETGELVGSAVQIGDPITEKGLIELVERARDAQLYNAITDCGAGGFSSAIGEMGEELGVDVELTQAPLKYPGLTPWEIWISEAQERMVMAVTPAKLGALQKLADAWDVELSVLGFFTGDRQLRVRYEGEIVADLPMDFLHDGLPRRRMTAVYRGGARGKGQGASDESRVTRSGPPAPNPGGESPGHPVTLSAPLAPNSGGESPGHPVTRSGPPAPNSGGESPPQLLLAMLAHPSVASKEAVVRTYDHEVRGGTLVRPFTGPAMDGPTDAAVLKPLGAWDHPQAVALSAGLNPLLGKRDPYAMAVSAIDEAMRNAVAVGADPDRVAILDNFCWGNPTYPDRLGALVRACQGCYDGATTYGTPFISGKDSLYNEFNGEPIPGTLLISAISVVPEMAQVVTSDLKQAGDRLYLLGETRDELGGSLLYHLLGVDEGDPPAMPDDPLARYRLSHAAIREGKVRACHDLSEGGLAVALAEMALAGRLGVRVTLPETSLSAIDYLFSESNGRLLVEVAPEDAAALESHFQGQTFISLGQVTDDRRLTVLDSSRETVINLPVDDLVSAWKREGAA